MDIISIKNLNAGFPTKRGVVTAVTSVDLTIKEGECLGLIGETGCGKTVLGMAVMRLLQPNAIISGEILYKGQNLLALEEEDMRTFRGKELGIILQNSTSSLNPVLSVGDQIAEGIILHQGLGKREAREKAIELLEKVQIKDAAAMSRRYPHEFSGGMRERAMIAIALACSPSFVIADEPTTGLDNRTMKGVISLLAKVARSKSMLFITHDLAAACEICDTVAVMYAGEIVEWGNVEEVFSAPRHPYTRGLLNSLPERGFIAIPGSSPSLIELPCGCRFSERCSFSEERCIRVHPLMEEISSSHKVRCHLYD